MLRFLLVFAVCWCLGAPSAFGPAQPQAQTRPADKRIALVIGNGRYPAMPLPNPENDARLIAANLRKLGFEVNEQLNLGVRDFRRVLREFSKRLQEDDAVAVLYYAGHGVQIDGRNYLLPVDLNLRDQEEVKDESVDIEDLFLSRLDRARSSARIVILDACRDNPFAGKTRNVRSAGGLAEMGARGTLIAYASAPGQPAEDGPTGRNSVYTKSLAEEMMVPGLEVEQMFKNVRVKVLRDTKERQVPWVNTSLVSNFSFNPAAGRSFAVAPGAGPVGAPERTYQPNELEQQLERARRERDEALAAVRAGAPAVAAPAPTPQLAPAQSVAANTRPAALPDPQLRRVLQRADVEQSLVGKSHLVKDLATNALIRWNLRAGGQVYYNSLGTHGSFNGSGRWELKDDGSLCARFNAQPPNVRASDARPPDDGCWYFFREGGKLLRSASAEPQARAQAEVVKIE